MEAQFEKALRFAAASAWPSTSQSTFRRSPLNPMQLGYVLRLPRRHPACRRREAQPGSCMERENLDGDVKGKGVKLFTFSPYFYGAVGLIHRLQ